MAATWTLIDALPRLTSPEELEQHQASTPASFEIPPVLRLKEENVTFTLKPALEGLDTAGESYQADLYVTEGSLLLFNATTSKGVSVPYPTIAVHAISRNSTHAANGDAPSSSRPSILCQLDSLGQDDDDYADPSELIIVPQPDADIEAIFEQISYCTSLHPSIDVNDLGSGEEEEEAGPTRPTATFNIEDVVDWTSVPGGYVPRDPGQTEDAPESD